ncbi:MAG: 4Fe-4S binding protein [Paludibacter sp.]|nr:4Fe-4S binding protein [Paludibacter sp.]
MQKIKFSLVIFSILIFFVLGNAQRFPEPDFESGYVVPETQTIAPRALSWEYLDVAVLFIALSVMSWFVIKQRSRKGIFWTGIFSIIYFGVFRVGCVCSVGSIQNVTLSLFQADYIIPITVIAFFALPLLFSLLFGRTFCAGVCFMGAVQDLVNIKPVSVPSWVSKPLSFIPYIYLILALLLAASGADFIICRYDPFIGFFRMNATFGMFVFGAVILILGIFIGRPYCRFLCPYGVLLSWMSKLAFWHTTITPSECIQCKLCDTSCPVDAINKPVNLKPESTDKGRNRLITLFVLLPVLILAGGFLASQLHKPLSSIHPTVKLANEIKWEQDHNKKTGTEESKAFHSTGVQVEQLFNDAGNIQKFFYVGSWIGGALLGLFFGISLLKTSVVRRQEDYVPDKGNCVSCGKCYKYCPVLPLTPKGE